MTQQFLSVQLIYSFNYICTNTEWSIYKLCFTDWEPVARDKIFYFDLDTEQLQIRTESDDGYIRVRFADNYTVSGPSLKVGLITPPTAQYMVKGCLDSAVDFELVNTTTPRVWTVGKHGGKLNLRCNGVQIFEIDLEKDQLCRHFWYPDFSRIVFPENKYLNGGKADNATDHVRKYTIGMTLPFFKPFCLIF